jgi:hypothetical protein
MSGFRPDMESLQCGHFIPSRHSLPVAQGSFVRAPVLAPPQRGSPRPGADPPFRFGLSVLASCGRKVRSVCRPLNGWTLVCVGSKATVCRVDIQCSWVSLGNVRRRLYLLAGGPKDGAGLPGKSRRDNAAPCSVDWRTANASDFAPAACEDGKSEAKRWVGACRGDPSWGGARTGTRTNDSGATGRECWDGRNVQAADSMPWSLALPITPILVWANNRGVGPFEGKGPHSWV